ncbi:MAG: YifB family Mg chelatase-like AAA ATPase [Clostridia bacterium]|nr:YifB family Mg chelatase-like AAA ATPase [Clostridia bacterium]
MVSKINSCVLAGLSGHTATVETDLGRGLPRFDVVGLPDASVKESRDRVYAAIKNCGFVYPVSRITVNLAPGELKKEGPIYDLPILVGILAASKQLPEVPATAAMIGELSLEGKLRAANGVLCMAMHLKSAGIEEFFVPEENAAEAAMVKGLTVYPVRDIQQLAAHLKGETLITPAAHTEYKPEVPDSLDFVDVIGQETAKRALIIAAAGGHHALLIGTPGSGKSMLAKRLPSILPDLSEQEALEVTGVYSVAGMLPKGQAMIKSRPVRAPHHSISVNGLAGGGTHPRPGEISLAHNGVLFLDELPEFHRDALETLRQPLEDGEVTISRVSATCTYPSRFMMICAMNPCRCGYYGHPTKSCTCSEHQLREYRKRISGPLLDRIDIHVTVAPLPYEELEKRPKGETSAVIREKINRARKIQAQRYKDHGITTNAQLTPTLMEKFCTPDQKGQALLKAAYERLGLSARGYDKLLKLARTIADLEGSAEIQAQHIAEAVQYRILDREEIM